MEKENNVMMTTKAASWLKTTGSLESSTLQSMSRGTKTSRDSTAAGKRALSLDGCGDNLELSHGDGDGDGNRDRDGDKTGTGTGTGTGWGQGGDGDSPTGPRTRSCVPPGPSR